MTHPDAPFARIGIVGLGLLGGSVALASRKAWPSVTLVGVDRRPAAIAEATRRRTVDLSGTDVAELDGSDLIVLAVPVSAMLDLLPAVARLSHPCVVTDVGSTKREVVAAARRLELPAFIGGHPMAGSERGGLDHATPDLFQRRPWLLVADDSTSSAATRVERFVAALGAEPQWIDADAHDRAIAFVSHLPQILAVALMNTAAGALDRRGLAAGGRAFEEMTRLASSPSDLWEGILTKNVDHVADALALFVEALPTREQLGDPEWIRDHFHRAAAARDGRPPR